MRGELLERDNAIANLNSEIKTLVGENKTLVADLLECRPALESVRDVKEREQAIAKLKTELEAREVKQLPNPNPVKPVLGGTSDRLTVGTPELVEYINSIEPGAGIIAKTIGNAITRKLNGNGDGNGKNMGRSLDRLESDYNFKHLGKFGNSHKFSIPKL